VLEKNQNLNDADAENEVAALLKEFVNRNDGEPGKCTPNQRRQLKALALHGRERFRAAARAWFAHHPWDSRTTDPFSAFIAGFEGYAEKKVHAEKEKAQREGAVLRIAQTTELHTRKHCVDYTGKLDHQFLASLTQEDRDYIKQVVDANRLDELPPDNGRNYFVEELEFTKRKRDEQSALTAKAIEDGSW
jgi:hypothetical protein